MSAPQPKKRVLYVLWTYPQLSQTYIQNEIEALNRDYDVHVVALSKPNTRAATDQSYTLAKRFKPLMAEIRAFRPDVLHSHWLNMAPVLHRLSRAADVPYTLRAHSFDVLGRGRDSMGRFGVGNPLERWVNYAKAKPTFKGYRPAHVVRYVNAPPCLGVLVFPHFRELLEGEGMTPEKLHDCFPVIDFRRFHDTGPNGEGVMNVGACIPKKRMEDFVDLGAAVAWRPFTLYAIGYKTADLAAYNDSRGGPIAIVENTPARDMPAQYKRHQWLVYTASRDFNSVGWPMAVAEAQAAGVGVCVPAIRPDLQTYLGGAGYAYERIEEVAEIVSGEVPAEMRERGFEQARRSDVYSHKRLLEDLWAGA